MHSVRLTMQSLCRGKKKTDNIFSIGKLWKHKNECKCENNIKTTIRIGFHIIVLTI